MRKAVFWLSLILIFMVPWENSITVGSLGTLTRVIGLLVAAVWVGTVLITGRFRKLHPFHLAVSLFVLWNLASAFWSLDAEGTEERVRTYVQVLGLVIIIWDLYSTPEALRAGLQAYILGAYVAILSTVSNYLGGIEAYIYSQGRYAGAGMNANDLALILALGLPVAWHLAVSAGDDLKGYVVRLINYAFLPAALFSVLLTASRMGLFVIVPAFFFVLRTFAWLKPSSRLLIVVVAIGTLFALHSHLPQSSLDRLATATSSISGRDLGGRVAIWNVAIAAFLEHPVLGVGSGAFRAVARTSISPSGTVVHNTFLSVLAELGLVGFFFFVIILVITAYQVRHQPKLDARLWLTILLIWAIGVSTLTWEYRKPTWLFLSLVVVGVGLSEQRNESISSWAFPGKQADLPTSSVAWRDPSAHPKSFYEQGS